MEKVKGDILDIAKLRENDPILEDLRYKKEVLWINENKKVDNFQMPFSKDDIDQAERRLERFAPLIMDYFEDTRKSQGIIESPLKRISNMEKILKERASFKGKLYLKLDSHLPVAGSIKARGGIYEVLYHAEKLALENKMVEKDDDYRVFDSVEFRKFFSDHTIQVGSTGNLGLSIGISAAALGFRVIVHMSSDAKEWKKDLLRSKGAEVVEYDGDFTRAVEFGREESLKDPKSYFVDDENSKTLFLGYAVAANRIKRQVDEMGIKIDKNNPAIFYLPCGVGGSPGGVAYGLKTIFKDNCHIFFVEPTSVPSMLLGMATGLHNKISVKDIGLDGKTEADGLAVGRPSGFVGKLMEPILDGIFTLDDYRLFSYMRDLNDSENIQIEPSACACLHGVNQLFMRKKARAYLKDQQILDKSQNISHIARATGGSLVPKDLMEEYLKTFIDK